MSRIAIKATAAVYAAAITIGGLKGIAVLATVAAPAARIVVELPKVEVTASALPSGAAPMAAVEVGGRER